MTVVVNLASGMAAGPSVSVGSLASVVVLVLALAPALVLAPALAWGSLVVSASELEVEG